MGDKKNVHHKYFVSGEECYQAATTSAVEADICTHTTVSLLR